MIAMGSLTVRRAGFFTTVQDGGRYGYQPYGVPVSGAMDWLSAELANRLVGNPAGTALLEITLGEFSCVMDRENWVAVTGADVAVALDSGASPGVWQAFKVMAGEELRLSRPPGTTGMRSYMAVAGGFRLDPVLGSCSTFVAAGIGPLPRPLKAGDRLDLGSPGGVPVPQALPIRLRPRFPKEVTVRVVLGPQAHRFTDEAVRTFLGEVFVVTPQSDRTGYRLQGPPIRHTEAADIISDPIPTGAVQVPGSGQPVLLMVDHRVTGGYAKIATVIGCDLPLVGQMAPGSGIRFGAVSVDQAHAARRELRQALAAAGFA